MIRLLLTLIIAPARLVFRSRLELLAENLALRQQLAVFKQKRSRARMGPSDRLFWVFLRSVWRNWANALIAVEPDTVVQWHSGTARVSSPREQVVPGSRRRCRSSSGGWPARMIGERLRFTVKYDGEKRLWSYENPRRPTLK